MFSFRATQAARSLGRLPRWGWGTQEDPRRPRGVRRAGGRGGAPDSRRPRAGAQVSSRAGFVPGASASAAPAPGPGGGRGLCPNTPRLWRGAGRRPGSPRTVRPGPPRRAPPPPRRRWARRPPEPQVVPRAGPFLLPLSFLSPPLPLARCRRHFPRFLLPLQSGGREGAAGSFLPPCKLERDSGLHSPPRPPRPAPGSCSLNFLSPRGPGTPAAGGRGRAPGSRGSDPPEPFPAAARAPLPLRPPARRSVLPARLASSPRREPPGCPPAPRRCPDFPLCWMRTRAPRRRAVD